MGRHHHRHKKHHDGNKHTKKSNTYKILFWIIVILSIGYILLTYGGAISENFSNIGMDVGNNTQNSATSIAKDDTAATTQRYNKFSLMHVPFYSFPASDTSLFCKDGKVFQKSDNSYVGIINSFTAGINENIDVLTCVAEGRNWKATADWKCVNDKVIVICEANLYKVIAMGKLGYSVLVDKEATQKEVVEERERIEYKNLLTLMENVACENSFHELKYVAGRRAGMDIGGNQRVIFTNAGEILGTEKGDKVIFWFSGTSEMTNATYYNTEGNIEKEINC